MRKSILLLCLVLAGSLCGAQKVYQDEVIRFAVWAQRDAIPGFFDEAKDENRETAVGDSDKKIMQVPIKRIREICPFIITGMTYGWKFDYTPYDKARNVDEFFGMEPVQELNEEQLKMIHYELPWFQDERLWCWVKFERTAELKRIFLSWQQIGNPRIRGQGYAPLIDGFEGIYEASVDALKNAVREYERKLIKNKPKEISGSVIICEPPTIGIDHGKYKITLDFFMECDRIIQYETF